MHTISVCILDADVTKPVKVLLPGNCVVQKNPIEELCFAFLAQAEMEFLTKDMLYYVIKKGDSPLVLLSELKAMELDDDLYGALVEIVTA